MLTRKAIDAATSRGIEDILIGGGVARWFYEGQGAAKAPVDGTPLEKRAPVDPFELVRMIAVTRLLMPKARVRLSAGREQLTREAQVLSALAAGDTTADEVVERVYADVPREVWPAARLSVLAQLAYLRT